MSMTDIFVTELEGGYTLQFPMVPDRIVVEAAARFISYDIMNIGEVKIPLGDELTGFSWSGILPGEKRKGAPYVRAWTDPKAVQSKFSVWRNGGKKLRLTIPDTTINHAVYLESYQCEYSGGAGDIEYSIKFIVAKEIIINTEGQAAAKRSTAGNGQLTVAATATPQAQTYTVKSGDTLWKIAQKQLGDGSRWREIYNLNKSVIGSNPDLIRAGQVYNLPA